MVATARGAINPSWYVPRSIVVNEYLPQLKRNRNAAGPRVRIGMSGFAGELHCAGTGAAAADSTGGVVTSASTADGAVVDVLLPTGDLMGKTTTFRCARVSVSVS